MSIAKAYESNSGQTIGWMIYCPACQLAHQFPLDRWSFNGDPDRPTFSPSMLAWRDVPGPDGQDVRESCHSFVRDGRIEYLGDCTHAMAGQTVDLPEFRFWPDDDSEAAR